MRPLSRCVYERRMTVNLVRTCRAGLGLAQVANRMPGPLMTATFNHVRKIRFRHAEKIGMTKPLRIVQNGDNFRCNAKQGHFSGIGRRHDPVFWISPHQQVSRVLHLSTVLNHEHPSGERQAFNQKRLSVILRNRDRDPRIAPDIGVFLAVSANEAVKYEALISIPNYGSLGPPIRAVRSNCQCGVPRGER